MKRLEDLNRIIKDIKDKLEPLEQERRDLWNKQSEDIDQKNKEM